MSRFVPLPLLAAALALAGATVATAFLYREASHAAEAALDQRLLGAGNTAALLLGPAPTAEQLKSLMAAESLDGALVVDRALTVAADANGAAGERADLLRIDAEQVAAARAGTPSVAHGYDVGGLTIRTGYTALPGGNAVLVLEAGARFGGAAQPLDRALLGALALAFLGAVGLAAIATRQARSERARQEAALLTQVAAAAAHEIRNPLGVIRGTVELMRERPGLDDRGREALADVLGEVERLKRLTEDLLDLSADRPLARDPFSLGELLADAAAATRAAHPKVQVALTPGPAATVRGDAGRLRQVFLNLLWNAAQAAGGVEVGWAVEGRAVCVFVADDGPGIAPEVAARLFEPFATTRAGGTGLGLAVSKRLVERHGGTLRLAPSAKGARFEVRLPLD